MFTLLQRIIKLGWANFERNSGLSFATVFILLIMLSLITSLFLVHKTNQQLILTLQKKVDISVYFKPESAEKEILEIKKEIEKLPQIKQIRYVSRQEALEKFTQRYQQNTAIMESLKEVGTNPLYASLNIRAWEAAQYPGIINFINHSLNKNLIAKINYFQKKPIIEKLSSITDNINKIGIALSAILAMLTILIVYNTVKLSAYTNKREIEVMRLVGISNWFIRGPFVIQGIISSFLAALITVLIFSVSLFFLNPRIGEIIPGLNLAEYFFGNLWTLFLIQFVLGAGITVISSWIATRKYLKI